jgi:KaiC/GvpD/RAD55 family RecA-like ATPase
MASRGKGDEDAGASSEEPTVCAVCGGDLNERGECTVCGTKIETLTKGAGPRGDEDAEKDGVISQFTEISGVGQSKAEVLFEAGYRNLEDLRAARTEELAAVNGIGEKLAATIHAGVNASAPSVEAAPPEDESGGWLADGESEGSLATWLGGGATTTIASDEAADDSVDALKKWLSGEADSLEDWLGEGAAAIPSAGEVEATPALAAKELELSERARNLEKVQNELEAQRLKVEELKNTITRELKKLDTGTFDPMRLIEETADISKDLQTEIRRRKRLQEEIEHIKKGTTAVVRYLKAQMVKGGSPDVKKRLSRETAERKKLEKEVETLRGLVDDLKGQLEDGLSKLPEDQQELKRRELELTEKERELEILKNELETKAQAIVNGEAASAEATSEELQARFQEELREKDEEFLKKEEELRHQILRLEEEISRYRIDEKLRKESEELRNLPQDRISAVLVEKEKELQSKEKSILIREDEIQRLKDELKEREEELNKIKEPLSYKEEELLRREEDLMYREKKIAAERRKLEEARALGGTLEEAELKQRLEQLRSEINRKEDEVRAKETYLKAKMEELRLREQGLIEEELERSEALVRQEVSQEKVKTGTPRLDDLLLGGLPFGCNTQVYGPPFVGKEVVVNAFMAEGLKKGIPIIWVLSDKMPSDVREEMEFVISGYEEYEKLGLVRYVDTYSKSMGETEEDPYTVYVDDPTDYDTVLKVVDEISKELRKKYQYYRLAFRSVSTLVAYLDTQTLFKFLQSFAGRRKRDRAVSLYLIEKGMHGEQEIQMIGSMMDGMLDFKVEQLKTYLSVKGICDVQSRSWIQYFYSKSGVSIGSFSLDHIR